MKSEETRNLIESVEDSRTTFLGTRTSSLSVEEDVTVDDSKRRMHVLSVGPIGYGKTQLLVHAALQDAYKGNGFCAINPKGDMIDELLAKLPSKRLDDVVYINPARDSVTPINVLEPHITRSMNQAQKENQKEIIVSDLIDLFRRHSKEWGDRFGRVLETLLRAHLDLNIYHDEKNTLLDVFECVVNSDALTELIDRTHDQVVREQLVRIQEDMTSYEMEPLQRRLNDFVMNPTIRRVISSEESGVEFREAVNNGKIILVDIQKGEVGGTVSKIIGSIVTTKIWAATQSRITQPFEKRRPFYLYVDELQNFAGEGSNFTKILAEAREYRLGCWLATQYLHQLSTEMRRAVTNNCRTKIVFNPEGSEDLNRIVGMLNGVNKKQLKSLGKYRAVVNQPSEKEQSDAVITDTYPPWNADRSQVENIKEESSVEKQASEPEMGMSLGRSASSGGEKHSELLAKAKEHLEELEGVHVNLLYQDSEDKPDGYVTLPDGSTAHLEAEASTLTRPVKVLRNYLRAVEEDREAVFVVEEGKATKLQNIVEDPKNRRGNEYEDDKGSYTYYKDEDGEPFTDFEKLEEGEYRIIEVSEDELEIHNDEIEEECPELEHSTEEELRSFCLYREEGFCSELETECVIK
ncbi:MAG: TraM recognition domain-containing protein [Halobacteriales archaeon]|nr:TraM recognition domain-containing protein [Halobacteriales archaeon]